MIARSALPVITLLAMVAGTASTTAQVGGRVWRTLLEIEDAATRDLHMSSIGDVDGDGLADLAFVEWTRATVRSGKDGSILLLIDDPSYSFYLGAEVAPAGDADGDGVPDLALGLPGQATNTGAGTGAIFILSGRDGHEIRMLTVDLYTVNLGWSMANIGDVDGDGVDDLAAGVARWWIPPPGGTGSGRVFLWSGRTGNSIWVLEPPDGVFGLGMTVAGAGDVDGDGVPDIVAASTRDVCLYSGATGRLLDWLRFEPSNTEIQLAGGADWNGDGLSEICMGFRNMDGPAGEYCGMVLVWSHAAQADILRIHGPAPWSSAGRSLAVGNVDGEPDPELIVGAPGWAPMARLRYGAVLIYDIPDGSLLHLEPGPGANYQFGTEVEAPGDTDGDGFGDVLVADDQDYNNGPPRPWVFGLVPFLLPRHAALSSSAGGKLVLDLDFGWEQAFHAYRVLASAHGTGPGLYQGLEVPLTPDALFFASGRGDLPAWAWNFDGVLDLEGRASAVALPPPGGLPAALVGRALTLAAVAGPLSGLPETASLPVTVEVLP